MKAYILFFLAILITRTVFAQKNIDTAGAMQNLKFSATKMVGHLRDNEFDSFVRYTHPKIISMIGGKAKMIDAIKTTYKQINDGGFKIDSVLIGEPDSIIVTKTELQDVLPEILEMKGNGGKLIATSYLLAVSNNEGKTWYFIDTSGKTLQQMQTIFPTLSNKLVIPAKRQPKFYRD